MTTTTTTTTTTRPPPTPGCEDPLTRPNVTHEFDCGKFYRCSADGLTKVLHHCRAGTLFSEVAMACKPSAEVTSERPECGGN